MFSTISPLFVSAEVRRIICVPVVPRRYFYLFSGYVPRAEPSERRCGSVLMVDVPLCEFRVSSV